MKKIIIYYQLNAELHQWIQIDEAGKIIQAEKANTLTQIAHYSEDSIVTVLISSTLVYTTTTMIPASNYHQMSKAIPYAIEEELTEDVSKLHFAVGLWKKSQPVTVCVINKVLLEKIITAFNAANISIHYLIPDFFGLPCEKDSCSITTNGNQVIIHSGKQIGFSINIQHIAHLLPLLTTQQIKKIFYYSVTKQNALEAVLQSSNLEFYYQSCSSLLELAACNLFDDIPINLLQGNYKQKLKHNKTRMAWYMTAVTFGLWLLISTVGSFTSYFYYRHQQKKFSLKINSIYKEIFPKATSVVSPKIRIEREIKKYSKSANDDGFLLILAKLGPILQQMPNLNIENLAFQNQILIASMKTNSFQNLQRFSKRLATTGLQFKQINAATKNQFIVAEYHFQLNQNVPKGKL